MTGTIINVAAILVGGMIGLFFGARLPERLKSTVTLGMGLFTAAIGIKMFLPTNNSLIVLGAILIGALLGEWWRIEDRLEHLGQWLEARFSSGGDASLFVRGFLTASLLFAIGPMAIVGSINDGLTGNFEVLAIKSVLDFFASIAFASTLGVGVLFSALIILVYQGGISLLAMQMGTTLLGSDPSTLGSSMFMIELTATGGVILFGLAIARLLEIKPIRVGNFLPALAIAPLIVWILELLKNM